MIDIAPAALSTARHVKGELSLLLLSPPFASQTTKSYPNAALPKRREPFTIMALPGDCSRGPQNAQHSPGSGTGLVEGVPFFFRGRVRAGFRFYV